MSVSMSSAYGIADERAVHLRLDVAETVMLEDLIREGMAAVCASTGHPGMTTERLERTRDVLSLGLRAQKDLRLMRETFVYKNVPGGARATGTPATTTGNTQVDDRL